MSSVPKCKCGRICLSKEAYKGENRGRWYWKCATSRCRFFEWNDPGLHLYTPIVFTSLHPTSKSTRKPSKTIETTCEQRDTSILHTQDISYPLGARKSRLASTPRPKRSRTSESASLNITKTTIQLALYTNTDISVTANDRHRYIQTLFRTVKGIEWNERLRMWVFSADQQMYQTVWTLLHRHRATFEVTGVPLAILRYLPKTTEQLYLQQIYKTPTPPTPKPTLSLTRQQEATDNNDDDFDDDNDFDFDFSGGADDIVSDLPISWFQQEVVRGSKLWQSMTRKQRAGVKKGTTLEGSIYLQDPIGSGQSYQALAMALIYQEDWPVLIVCRSSVCLKWKKLIQIMLQLDSNDICLLDRIGSYGGKKVYSNKRKAIQSRLYRQQRRELLQHQLRQGLLPPPLPPSSTTTTASSLSPSSSSTSEDKLAQDGQYLQQQQQQQQKSIDASDEGGWQVSLTNDGGEDHASFDFGSLSHSMKTIKTTSSNGDTIGSISDSLNKKRKLEQQEEQQWYIDMTNCEMEALSDYEEEEGEEGEMGSDDDGVYDSGHEEENDSYDVGTSSTDNTYASETINSMGTSPTLVENDNNNNGDDDGEAFNKAIFSTAQFFIISYDKAKTRLSSLGSEKFKIAIFDDCHDIKTTMIPTYRAPLQKFVRGTKKTIMVSSIPIIPRPMETFPLLQIIKPNLFVDYKYFGQRYCDAKHVVFGWDYTGTSNEFELAYFLDRTVLVA